MKGSAALTPVVTERGGVLQKPDGSISWVFHVTEPEAPMFLPGLIGLSNNPGPALQPPPQIPPALRGDPGGRGSDGGIRGS